MRTISWITAAVLGLAMLIKQAPTTEAIAYEPAPTPAAATQPDPALQMILDRLDSFDARLAALESPAPVPDIEPPPAPDPAPTPKSPAKPETPPREPDRTAYHCSGCGTHSTWTWDKANYLRCDNCNCYSDRHGAGATRYYRRSTYTGPRGIFGGRWAPLRRLFRWRPFRGRFRGC